ncbi:hypothetical protein Pst134EA_032337 [Puccinia striiformis f. sp. tritici]|uniref:uncharacterized protein n=1 Tax=Puccinia striiformis f. sp. tritici TaxID=168172 RepID=UPI002007C2EE|nr:uncharacterized protein Pst134EA_032337 [Puccinia striiformis f. sp. tritici]KAH9444323.1 hypothetical protein Pst134EA_032337 [Puccinia striiformis f. sp. tritici]
MMMMMMNKKTTTTTSGLFLSISISLSMMMNFSCREARPRFSIELTDDQKAADPIRLALAGGFQFDPVQAVEKALSADIRPDYPSHSLLASQENQFGPFTTMIPEPNPEPLKALLPRASGTTDQFGNGDREDLVNCINQITPDILSSGASCVETDDRTVIKSPIKSILEQYLGMFTAKTIEEIVEAFDRHLAGSVPSDEHELFTIVHESLLPVSASLTGNAVTVIEKAEECIMKAYKTSSPLVCPIPPTGRVQKTLEVSNGVGAKGTRGIVKWSD